MKKYSFFSLAAALTVGLIFSGCGFAGFNNGGGGAQGSGTAKTEQRTISGFSKIEAGSAVHLEITAQKDFAVSVEADDNLLPIIKTDASGDTLKIYSEGKFSPRTKINIKISMPELKGLDLSGASNAVVTNAKTDALDLEASGASKIKIDGAAKELKSRASGASGIDAESLTVENADAEASGASSTTVSATNELTADASGASTIYYAGEPKSLKQNSSGASSIKKK